MKLAPARVEAFLRQPDPAITAALVYGPDRGLVRERLDALTRQVAGDVNDPFRVIELSAADLKADTARLSDEAGALAMTGGRRVVRVRDGADALSAQFKALFSGPAGPALIVVEAGELGPRSSLRRLFEGTEAAAAIACYADDARSLRQVIETSVKDSGLALDGDALSYLMDHLGSDRRVTRGELEKLILYMGSPADNARVSLDDVQACIGDNAASSLDGVIQAAFGGDRVTLDRTLYRAFEEGVHPVAVLRAASRHAQRLHLTKGLMAGGRNAEQAMSVLKPRVMFKLVDGFRRQLSRWSGQNLAAVLENLSAAEIDCKSTGMPNEAICSRVLLRIAQKAGK